MSRPRATLVLVTTASLLVGLPAVASALVLLIVLSLLTLFSVVGITFVTASGEPVRQVTLHVVPLPGTAPECDIEIQVFDDQGVVVGAREARVRAGETLSQDYRGRGTAGSPERIRAAIKSRTVGPPLPPGPCPILASLQITNVQTGATEAVLLPAEQREVREAIR